MAGSGDIKQRIVLEGEKEYSSALKEAQRNLKTLRSELKAETAELGANATAQQKNEVRTKNLQKQIREQEKVVKTYEKALAEVKEKYGDNEDAISKWEVKLNEARASLANMKNSIDQVGTGIQNMGTKAKHSGDMATVATNAFADSLGKVADVGASISGAIEGFFGSMIGTITDAIGALWDQLMDVAARANQWGDIAGYWNTSATNIQKWYHAVEGTYNEFASLSSAVTRIVEGDQKKIAEASGVSSEAYADKWEYAMAVMDSLSHMSYEQRLAATGEIFGEKRATAVLDLLNDWGKIQENLARYDAENGGFGLTEENLQKASDLAEQVANLKESWQALKDMASIELFGDLALNITGNMQAIVDALKDYFNADNDADKQAALAKIRENVTEIFKQIAEAIRDGIALLRDVAKELEASNDETTKSIGKLLNGILDLFQWIAEPANCGKLKTAFDVIIGVWASAKVAQAISNLAKFGANLKTVFGFNSGSPKDVPVVPPGGGGGGFFSGIGDKIAAAATSTAGTAAIGGAIAVGMWMGIGALAKSFNQQTDMEYNAERYNGVENAQVLQSAVNGILKSNDANAGWQLRWMASHYGAEEFWDLFNYNDKNRGASNYLLDILGQTDDSNMQAMAAFYDMWQRVYGDIDYTARGNDVYRGMTAEQQQALRNAQEAYAQVNQSGADMDYTWLLMNYRKFFEHNGIFDENGNWTIPGIYSDTWQNGASSGIKTELSADAETKLNEAVRKGVSGIQVYMDGEKVGYLVSPYVSQQIAREAV